MTKNVLKIGPNALTEYDAWMKSAEHGDVLVYWTGDLASDRTTLVKLDDDLRKRINVINAIADRVAGDAKAGSLILVQKRKSLGVFEYRAFRKRRALGPSPVEEVISNGSTKLEKVLELA